MSLLHRTNSGTRRNSGSSSHYGNNSSNDPWGSHSPDIPQAFADDETYINVPTPSQRKHAANDKKKANKRYLGGVGSRLWGTGRCSWMTTCGIVTFFLMVTGYTYSSYHERKMMEGQLVEQDATMRELEIDMARKFDAKVKEMRSENAVLRQQLSEQEGLKIKLASREDSIIKMQDQLDKEQTDIKFLGSEYKKVTTAKTKLQQNIQLLSRTILLEKFGPGPHKLDMHLRFDSHKGVADGGIIKIEMAPIDEMPHAVYWFLEQVSRKLYDGFSFHHNAGHVIQANALSNFLTPPDHRPDEEAMRKAGFHQILFQEYSKNFPHAKYTIGYGGRPGGPAIYINTKNNTLTHGPGGQAHYDDPMEADSCFAKVIGGFDVLDRMLAMPFKKKAYRLLEDNVAIVHIQILENK